MPKFFAVIYFKHIFAAELQFILRLSFVLSCFVLGPNLVLLIMAYFYLSLSDDFRWAWVSYKVLVIEPWSAEWKANALPT